MSKALPIVVATLLGGAALVPVYYATQKPAQTSTAIQAAKLDVSTATAIEKLSYAFGYEVASQTPELDMSAFNAGAQAGHLKEQPLFTPEELHAASQEFAAEQQAKQQQAAMPMNEAVPTNSADAEFLVENAKKPDVKTTASGLQYIMHKEGTGKQPAATNVVKVHYEGKLVNGEVFDSSFARNEPIEFPLNQVIAGWTEGLQLMKEGGEATFFIPANLGYGAQGQGPIPPNSTLIFKVQLIEVK